MKEKDWVKSITLTIEEGLQKKEKRIKVFAGHRLAYANEILNYGKDNKAESIKPKGFETDILINEIQSDGLWKPRIVIETKLKSVTTHDAITYSQKAQSHKYVHPFLRYGILIGKREAFPLPGRLFRHGYHFDFMLSWKSYKPDNEELKTLLNILQSEIETSRNLEEIIFNSRSKDRKRFTTLHKPLMLK